MKDGSRPLGTVKPALQASLATSLLTLMIYLGCHYDAVGKVIAWLFVGLFFSVLWFSAYAIFSDIESNK